ncbi:MAG: class I SAM-dependent methyltransferase [Kofleriaceae bacterium]
MVTGSAPGSAQSTAPSTALTARGDLSVTALYTAQAWAWGKFDGAALFKTWKGRDVWNATNLALGTARLFRRDLPSLRHGLVQRHAMIDALVAGAGCGQVLELAAGLSRRGASLSRDPACRYVEVDLPAVIAHKRRLLARSAGGRAVAARPNLMMIEHDVTTLAYDDVLAPGPVCVVAEGLLVYLDAAAQQALWARLAAVVAARPGSCVVFDLVPFVEQPRPGRIGLGLERLFRRATRGAGMAFDGRTRGDLARELATAGFGSVETFEPRSAPAAWAVPHLDRPTQQLVWRVAA